MEKVRELLLKLKAFDNTDRSGTTIHFCEFFDTEEIDAALSEIGLTESEIKDSKKKDIYEYSPLLAKYFKNKK